MSSAPLQELAASFKLFTTSRPSLAGSIIHINPYQRVLCREASGTNSRRDLAGRWEKGAAGPGAATVFRPFRLATVAIAVRPGAAPT